MTGSAPAFESPAAQMRHAFDTSFAAPVATAMSQSIDFVALHVGEESFAVRIGEIGGLFADVPVTAIPGNYPALRGIAGFRGDTLPVYDLGVLLGLPASATRWLLLDATRAVALAFTCFDDHFRAEPSALLAIASEGSSRAHAHEAVQRGTEVRLIIDIPSILSAIRDQAGRAAQRME